MPRAETLPTEPARRRGAGLLRRGRPEKPSDWSDARDLARMLQMRPEQAERLVDTLARMMARRPFSFFSGSEQSDKLLDVEEFAAAHSEQPSAWQVRKLCREGLLPDASMPGKRWKIPARLLSEPLPKVAVSFFLEKEGKRNG